MMLLGKLALSALTLVGGTALLTGCQSSGGGHSDGAMSPAAIACDKCKTTYTRTANPGGSKSAPPITTYRTVAQHECPECRDVAKNILVQGKVPAQGTVVHTCKACGGEMKMCHTN